MSLAWLCANGAIWDFVQVFAWVKMFSLYSQTMTVERAITITLDGSNPCELCTTVANAKDLARKQPQHTSDGLAAKLVLACESPSSVVFLDSGNDWQREDVPVPSPVFERVPVPPPRA